MNGFSHCTFGWVAETTNLHWTHVHSITIYLGTGFFVSGKYGNFLFRSTLIVTLARCRNVGSCVSHATVLPQFHYSYQMLSPTSLRLMLRFSFDYCQPSSKPYFNERIFNLLINGREIQLFESYFKQSKKQNEKNVPVVFWESSFFISFSRFHVSQEKKHHFDRFYL